MATWDRDTPWRQGQLLTAKAAVAFGLTGGGTPQDTAVVVISHDCDLAQPPPSEPKVEVIVGRFLEGQPNGAYTHCKNPRKLHIECTGSKATRVVELEVLMRTAIDKDASDTGPGLADFAPCAVHRIQRNERNTLQRWLALRYRRSAFPDEFDRRLKQTGVAERLAKVFKDSGTHVIAVFFDVDQGEEKARQGADDTYELFVTLLYGTAGDPEAAEKAATSVSKAVDKIFRQRCMTKRDGVDIWQWIEMRGVDVISDQAMTYADSQQLSKWQADHISLRTEPPQPLLRD